MHHIYHTEGIILGSKNYGEAGKYYNIFTRDLGMIYASASGVRKMPSKLRFILQDYAYVKIDLVRGKDFWRITSDSKTNLLEEIKTKKENLKIVANVSLLLVRLLAGEDANPELFADVLAGLFLLEKAPRNEIPHREAMLVLRILHHLGYMRDLDYLPEHRLVILREINKVLKETHL